MLRTTTTALVMTAAIAFVGVLGCTTNEDVASQPEPDTATAPADVPPEIAAELADLSESDRALAIEQRICPVAGKPLGSMGTPVKLTVEGREVFICCESCEEELRSNPEKYFAKLDSDSA